MERGHAPQGDIPGRGTPLAEGHPGRRDMPRKRNVLETPREMGYGGKGIIPDKGIPRAEWPPWKEERPRQRDLPGTENFPG